MGAKTHKKIKELMKNKTLSEREFFENKKMNSHLEDIARALTKRWKGRRKINVVVEYNDNELWSDNYVAYTTYNQIHINAGHPFVKRGGADGKLLTYQRVLGLFAHELGHILWTDFVSLKNFQNKFLNSKWLVQPDYTNEMRENEEDLFDFINENEQNKKLVLDRIFEVSNILEDGFIERQILLAFPGTLSFGLNKVRKSQFEESPTLEKMIETESEGKSHIYMTSINMLLLYAKYGKIKVGTVTKDDEHFEIYDKLIPIVDECMQSDGRERFKYVVETMLILFPYLKDLIEKNQPEDNEDNGDSENQNGNEGNGSSTSGGSGTSGNNNSSDEMEALNESIAKTVAKMAGQSQTPQGNTSPCASVITENSDGSDSSTGSTGSTGSDSSTGSAGSDSSGDSADSDSSGDSADSGDSNEKVNPENTAGNSQEKSKSGTGTELEYTAGKAEEGKGSGETTIDEDYQAQVEEDIIQSMEKIENSILENEAVSTLEKERKRDTQIFASNLDYGNIHKYVDKNIHRINEVSDSMIEIYDEISPPLEKIARNLARKYLQIADEAGQGGRLDGLMMGRKFNAGAAYRKDGKVFVKNLMPQQMAPLAVSLLVDESGSMSGIRSDVARATAIIIKSFCDQLKIPCSIYGHSTGYSDDVDLYSYCEFDDYNNMDKYRLVDISARSCNRDGCALRFMAERLIRRPEDAKVLMLISDGQPNGSNGYYGAEAEADLKSIQKEYTRKGVCFCAASIGEDKEVLQNIYGDAYLDVSNLNQLPNKLIKVLSKYLHTI